MSLNLNRVLIAGNLTRDPQVRFFANEKAVAEFGIAINHKSKDANGQTKEDVTFVDVECWGRTAELAGQYLTKGRGCFIEGRLKFDQWDDKESGQKRSKLKVVADNIQFTDKAQTGATAAEEAPPAPRKPMAAPVKAGDDSEPPFNRSEWEYLP